MKLTRWAISCVDEKGKRFLVGVDDMVLCEVYPTREEARNELRDWKRDGNYDDDWKARIERVIIVVRRRRG